jgi:uncharacterized phiE125 gp8 family phage protein
MAVRVVTPPSVEPITLDEAHDWIRDDGDSANDGVLGLLIKAMREYAETLTGRAFVQRTLELSCGAFWWNARCPLVLPYPPLVSVESVKYLDVDGEERTLGVDVYTVDADNDPGRIFLAYQRTWPATRCAHNAVRVRYVAGFPPVAADYRANIPACVKLWMHTRLATLFENREQLVVGESIADIPRDFADGLLDGATSATRFG